MGALNMKIHVVRPGETLASIALTYYGTQDAWAYIWRHNRHEIPDPNELPVGFNLVLPHAPGMVEFVSC